VLGHLIYTRVNDPVERKAMITKIGENKLDWRRTNVLEWESVIGVVEEKEAKGKTIRWITPRANRQAIDGTIKFLRDRSGLSAYLHLKEQEDMAVAPSASPMMGSAHVVS
jgi:hypothetical protein